MEIEQGSGTRQAECLKGDPQRKMNDDGIIAAAGT